jgi:CubicO group peptidase (beta-lactamase class C family)
MLRNGRWENKQVISEKWVREMLKPVTSYTEVKAHSKGYLNLTDSLGYGLYWWLWQEKRDPRFDGAYSAIGYMGQTITVLPAIDMVLVFKTKDDYQRNWPFRSWFRLMRLAAECYKSNQ